MALTHLVPVLPHICCANQLTGFYMGATLALNGLSDTVLVFEYLI